MEWLKSILPLIESGLKVYMSGQLIKSTSKHAKAMAVRSSVVAFGALAFLIFLLAAIIMIFVDLGHQFELHEGVHFSGMMLSGVYLTTLGLTIFGICFVVSIYLSKKEDQQKEQEKSKTLPYAALALFGEELLKQLLIKLSEKKSSSVNSEE